jgi:hypothetical protein
MNHPLAGRKQIAHPLQFGDRDFAPQRFTPLGKLKTVDDWLFRHWARMIQFPALAVKKG